jgi:hypothetical protein
MARNSGATTVSGRNMTTNSSEFRSAIQARGSCANRAKLSRPDHRIGLTMS